MDIPYDLWFRTVVLPIAAMEDGHLIAAISAVSLAIATGTGHVDGRVLPNYCEVLGKFLLDLPLPRIIYMLDYYLPQLQPWDKGSLHELSTMAAPIYYCP